MSYSRRTTGWHELQGPVRPGPALRALMITLAVVFAFQTPLNLESFAVLHPQEVWRGRIDQLFWYGWLHVDLLHLLFNLFGMWVFGTELERAWDGRSLVFYWVSCVIGAGFTHVLLDPLLGDSGSGVLGASGGVYGLMAAFGVLFRERKLHLLGILPVKAGTLAIGFGLLALWSGVAQSDESVAHFAHLGGMLTGLLLLYWDPVFRQMKLWRHRQRMSRYKTSAEETKAETPAPPPDVKVAEPEKTRNLEPLQDREEVNRRVDKLLEKVSRDGMDSLSSQERNYLDAASRYLKSLREDEES